MHLACELGELLLEMHGLRCERFRWVLQIGRIELREIARDALLQLRPPPLDFALREVLVTRVDRLELRSVDGDARFRQQSHPPAKLNELRAHLLDAEAVVATKVGDRLIVGRKPL